MAEETITHTAGEWRGVLPDDPAGQPQIFYRGLVCLVQENGETLAVVTDGRETSPGHWPGNTRLLALAPTAPHHCADGRCPGEVNRRKLAAFAGLFALLEREVAYRNDRAIADGRPYDVKTALWKDWACRFCVDEDTGRDFVCAYHEARALLALADSTGEGK